MTGAYNQCFLPAAEKWSCTHGTGLQLLLLQIAGQALTQDPVSMQLLLQQIISSGEYHILLDSDRLYAERLVPSVAAEPRPLSINSHMTQLISGGTRGLGLAYAQQLVQQGARCLVLLSRQPELSKDELAALASSGAAVYVVR